MLSPDHGERIQSERDEERENNQSKDGYRQGFSGGQLLQEDTELDDDRGQANRKKEEDQPEGKDRVYHHLPEAHKYLRFWIKG